MHHAYALRAPRLCALALLAIASFFATFAQAAAPRIYGTPPTSVVVGSSYYFKPTASDSDGNTLTFSIANKPGWASFSSSTGVLSGAPYSNHVGTYSSIVISVTDGSTRVSLPAFSIVVRANSNQSPVLSGTPVTTAKVGTAYAFQPSGRDPEGRALYWAIRNKPSWATFSTSTGKLSGTPTAAGTNSGITIGVSDGKSSAALAPFAIVVSTTSSGTTGSATLSWTPPTRNTDGSTLTNLAGYRISYGTSASALSKTISLANPGLSSYVVDNLAAGTWYFSIKAYTSSGTESAGSSVASKSIQ